MASIEVSIAGSLRPLNDSLYRRITWRLMPFLFVGYVFAYLDRVNVGFASLRMQVDLGFSAAIYGFGAGIFFIGYVLCEVPSNILLTKIGARKTFGRIMIGWGLLSASTMLVETPMQFYIVRFFLGAFEAGFFPGVILFITYWFPNDIRGRILSMFTIAIPISGIFGAPISGYIMSSMDGVNGWHGWQWMFLLEGIPAVLLGVLAFFMLSDRPADATWLSQGEKDEVIAAVGAPASHSGRALKDIFKDPRVYCMGYVFFAVSSGIYVISFWLPGMIKEYGVTHPGHVGLLTAIPYLAGAAGMVLVSRMSDRLNERRWHTAGCMILAALGLVISTFVSTNLVLGLSVLTIASLGIFGAMPVFWTVPSRYFSTAAAAAGIAFVNTIAQLAGFVSPAVIGWIKTTTGSISIGLYVFAAVITLGAVLLILSVPAAQIAGKEPPG